jgi:hypothetical protein
MINLDHVREEMMAFCERRQAEGQNYGAYRPKDDSPPDMYSACDTAIARTVAGEDLQETLTDEQRAQWIEHINSWCIDEGELRGAYSDTYGHHKLHGNGMVIGALGPLGGKQPQPVSLYAEFDTPEKVVPWLESIDWARQWGASHLFWGGAHCFSMSKQCTDEWRETVFDWLDANLDETTGWWRKGVPHADRSQPLGGSVHILPIYEHHGRPFPYPERVIDSVLALQVDDGRWYLESDPGNPATYLELDALYALKYMTELAPDYRKDDVRTAITRYGDVLEPFLAGSFGDMLRDPSFHPHWMLAIIGSAGLAHQHDPERFPASTNWTDIFSDLRLYRTAQVEILENERQ